MVNAAELRVCSRQTNQSTAQPTNGLTGGPTYGPTSRHTLIFLQFHILKIAWLLHVSKLSLIVFKSSLVVIKSFLVVQNVYLQCSVSDVSENSSFTNFSNISFYFLLSKTYIYSVQ